MSPTFFLGAEKLLQGRKKEPARSPEAKVVIIVQSSSKFWGGGFELFWLVDAPAPGPHARTARGRHGYRESMRPT